jgi:cysteine desulfurase
MGEGAIYLDNHATTRVDPRVLEEMLPWFGERFGNASSRLHAFGQEAADAVEAAREEVARAIGAGAQEITFTSGATESNRLAVEASGPGAPRPHVVASAIEHKSVLDSAAGRSTVVRPRRDGLVDPDAIRNAMTPATGLVCVMAANNEIGTLQPIAEIAAVAHAGGARMHCDATPAIGRIPFDVRRLGVDSAAFTAHKFHGPKGIGVLYAKAGAGRAPARPGTANVPGIVGLAAALRLCLAEREQEARRLRLLRDRLLGALAAGIDGVTVNGDLECRLPGNLNVALAGVDGRSLVVALEGLAISSGAACASASVEPSHVLTAIGRSREEALGSVRFGISRFNDEKEIDRAALIVVHAVRKLRRGPGFSGRGLESDPVLGKTSHADRQ